MDSVCYDQRLKVIGGSESADYSQIELRGFAHFSQDPELLEVYRTGGDIHTKTGFEETCAEACAPGVCRSSVDTGLHGTKATHCDDRNADICICTFE